MTIAEKTQISANTTLFTLFKEGLFYKRYNEDAMVFVERVKAYKITAKFFKSADEIVYSIGFPVSEAEKGRLSLANILEKIGAKGFEESDGNIVFLFNDINVGTNGNYWSSTVSGTIARNLNFNSSNANMNTNNRAHGNSVHCLKDYCISKSQPIFLKNVL